MILGGVLFSRTLITSTSALALGHADYVYYESLQDVYEKADVVVKGKIEKISKEQLLKNVLIGDDEDRVYTFKDVSVQTKMVLQEDGFSSKINELQEIKKESKERSITYDVYKVKISEVIKGDYKENDTIEVKLLSYDDVAQTKGKMNLEEEFYFFFCYHRI